MVFCQTAKPDCQVLSQSVESSGCGAVGVASVGPFLDAGTFGEVLRSPRLGDLLLERGSELPISALSSFLPIRALGAEGWRGASKKR